MKPPKLTKWYHSSPGCKVRFPYVLEDTVDDVEMFTNTRLIRAIGLPRAAQIERRLDDRQLTRVEVRPNETT